MKLILLPGNNSGNKQWIEDVSKNLSDLFDSTHILYYEHWNETGKDIDFDTELIALQKLIAEINDTDYIIFAKSAGTILALKAINADVILPLACIFTGFAYGFGKASGQDVDKWLEGYNIPTLFIQKEKDPAIHANELKEILENKKTENIVFETIPGGDHHYEDLDLLHKLISDYLSDEED